MNREDPSRRKRSLHRMLITRIAIVTVAVSVIVTAVVIYREQSRMLAIAHDRALIRTGTLAVLIKDQLDAPGLGDHTRIQEILDKVAHKNVELSTGYYAFARILDSQGSEVARIEDPEHENIEGIQTYAASEKLSLKGMKDGADFNGVRIGGRYYIHALVPLANSRGEAAAHVEAFFARTPQARMTALRNILGSTVLAVGIVLVTSLLLYPVIISLMRKLERLTLKLLDANLEMVGVVGSTIAKRDSDTDAHNFRVTIYSVRVAEALGLGDDMIRILIRGAFLHDVGKIGIRDAILLKPGRLDEAEFEEMKLHVSHGLDIVYRSEWLKEASVVVGGHHEKFEGNGYPTGLKGEDIPVLARIFAIADVFDALTSHRPYKQPLSFEETMDILMKGRGSHFDPDIIDVFMKIARPLYDKYGGADDSLAHRDLEAMVKQYYRADVAAFFD